MTPLISLKGWFKHLAQRYSDWCGDHEMELTIRRHLTDAGFYGGSAKLRNVRLVAVQRPGWQQIYRFEAEVRVQDHADDDSPTPPAEYRVVYGLARDDIRHKIESVRVFDNEAERRSLFARWSDGLICLRGAHSLLDS